VGGIAQRIADAGAGVGLDTAAAATERLQARPLTAITAARRLMAPMGSTSDALKVLSLVSAFRKRGHLVASLDPLGRGLGPLSEVQRRASLYDPLARCALVVDAGDANRTVCLMTSYRLCTPTSSATLLWECGEGCEKVRQLTPCVRCCELAESFAFVHRPMTAA
jgi:hypothetical protein